MICHLYDHQDDEGFYSGHRVSLTTLKCFPRFQSLPVCKTRGRVHHDRLTSILIDQDIYKEVLNPEVWKYTAYVSREAVAV